ncbi:MAG: GTP-binding protein, partial [Pseudomonadota bacterium]|nr:GTP-binding protein [Pseudomonadota bacterium]
MRKNLNKNLLKFITCGSIDDGKSTLIGRLLYDKKVISLDHLEEIENASKKFSISKTKLDFSFLLDGLNAEREQKITIDVAYKYFHTKKRKFIAADAPGHEAYTRNMVTGASNADLAIILVDANKKITDQCIKHALVCSFLRIKHILLAVNKMDLIQFSSYEFKKIVHEFNNAVKGYSFDNITSMPVSGLYGDNIVEKKKLKWFKGPTLIDYLENIEIRNDSFKKEFTFPVQLVQVDKNNTRRYLGTVKSGRVRVGEKVYNLQSREESVIKTIYFSNKKVKSAKNNQPISIELKKAIDISRGDILSSSISSCVLSEEIEANLIWIDTKVGFFGRSYYMKIGFNLIIAKIIKINFIVNNDKKENKGLHLNDLARVTLSLEKKIPLLSFEENKFLGSFILIDIEEGNTIAAGMIHSTLTHADNIYSNYSTVNKRKRLHLKGHKSKVIWFTGLSGSGKSTLANELEKKLYKKGIHTYVLDGDNLRKGINRDLDFSEQARIENVRRVSEIAKIMYDAGLVVIVSLISPYEKDRELAKKV